MKLRLRRALVAVAAVAVFALLCWPAVALEPVAAPTGLTGHRTGPAGYHSLAGASYSPLGRQYASAFDLRDLGKVSSVKDQSPYGTCWAFAALGSLESCLLPGAAWDFSEDSLAWFHGYDFARPGGGNAMMASAQLTRWEAPFTEAQDPYDDGVHPEPSGMALQKHVQDVVFLPPRLSATDNDSIKWALTTYGGVDTEMYADLGMQSSTTSAYWNESTHAYRYSGVSSANHDVLIVGWDDDYSKADFSIPPAGDGAFLVKNSWGSSWGDAGYFWVSYYDARIAYGGLNAVFMGAEPTDNYTSIYQWDPLGWTGYGLRYTANSTGWSANRFTADAGGQLEAVGFYTLGPNASYELFAGPSLASLTPYGSGTATWFGYHTVDLSQQVYLSSGEPFVVAVKITTPDFRGEKIAPIALEKPMAGYSSGATAAIGQSFFGPNGATWDDCADTYPNTNVCVKAYTAPAPPDAAAPVTTASGYDDAWHNKDVHVNLTVVDAGWGPDRFEVSIDGGSWQPFDVDSHAGIVVRAEADHTNDGVHTVAYRGVDKAGNVESPKSCTVKIDTRRPTTKAPSVARVRRGRTARLSYKVLDQSPNGGEASVTIRIKTLNGRTVKTLRYAHKAINANLTASFRCALARKSYRFYVYATDAAGNKQSAIGWNRLIVR